MLVRVVDVKARTLMEVEGGFEVQKSQFILPASWHVNDLTGES
jgi:hypothetical protein